MIFNPGDRVQVKDFEFKGRKGTIRQQYSEKIVLVNIDDFHMCVAMGVSNLEKLHPLAPDPTLFRQKPKRSRR